MAAEDTAIKAEERCGSRNIYCLKSYGLYAEKLWSVDRKVMVCR